MPTIDIPDKICLHCGGKKWYYKGNTISSNTYFQCYQKRKEQNKERYEKIKNNLDFKAKRKMYIKNWRLANKQHVKKYKLDYNKTEKGRAAKNKRALNPINNLTDTYLKRLLLHSLPSFVKPEDISKQDLALQRKNLSLKRKLEITRYKKESKILNIPEKICSHCGDTKWRKEKYFTKSNPESFRYRCVNLQNEYAKKSFQKLKLKNNGKDQYGN